MNKLDRYWSDSDNWRWSFVYKCSQDPRLIVPLRQWKLLFTFNFAHRSTFLLTGCLALLIFVPSMKAIQAGNFHEIPLTLAFSFLFAAVLIFVLSRVGRE